MSASSITLLIILTALAETRPPPWQRDDLQKLFGSHLSSLILAPPPPGDVTEGSAHGPSSSHVGLAEPLGPARGLAGEQEGALRLRQDFLWRRRLGGRGRKSVGGARGCFGMKMDRIGSLSGLGC